MYKVLLFLPALSLLLSPVSCTNFTLDMHNKRVQENFTSGLTVPADLDPAGTNAFSFVVMGDTHIGSPGGEVMQRVVNEAVIHGDAFALVAGDVTQGGLE